MTAGSAAMPHAGELLGADSVARTVAALAPVRIGHGVRAVEDPAVLRLLADRQIACEVCPASNVALGVAAGPEAVPLRALEAADVPVVLAADDPLLFGASLLDQYAVARDHHGYGRDDLARLARASVTHSLMPAELADHAARHRHLARQRRPATWRQRRSSTVDDRRLECRRHMRRVKIERSRASDP